VLFSFAREAAGALGARHSLRPLISQGQEFNAKLARNPRRDRGTVSARRCLMGWTAPAHGIDVPKRGRQ
jgi:hypothetical protein